MKPNSKINILLMPTEGCNMNCIYCFNGGHNKNLKKMSLDTLKQVYQIIFESYSDVTIVWHGGEPLMMGVDFYHEAIKLQKAYGDIRVKNRIQTNLTLINDQWIDFFIDNDFGLGSSFDGVNNDLTRGYSDVIMSNSNLLQKRGVKHSFIMVVSNLNIDTLIESYLFFKARNKGFTINMYVPTNKDDNFKLELEPNYTINKLNEFFDYWLYDTNTNISIRYFQMFIDYILLHKKNICCFTSCLGRWIGIKYDGEIVPCNRNFPKEYSYGNIWEYEKIDEAFESDGFIRILSESIERREKCKNCRIFDMCAGGCNNVALVEKGIKQNGGNSCIILQGVYDHIYNKLNELKAGKSNLSVNPFVQKTLEASKKLY